MQKNLLDKTLEELNLLPLWIKHEIFSKLESGMSNLPQDFRGFLNYIPELTYRGRQEIQEKNDGYDINTYNFLNKCLDGKNIVEISVDTYLTIEETYKIFLFSIMQGLVEKPVNPEICALYEYMAGKIRLGEYLLNTGKLNHSQLDFSLMEYNRENNSDLMFGEFLKMQYPSLVKDIDIILELKNEAQKRYIMSNLNMSASEFEADYQKNLENMEIRRLREENHELKSRYSTIAKVIKAGKDVQ